MLREKAKRISSKLGIKRRSSKESSPILIQVDSSASNSPETSLIPDDDDDDSSLNNEDMLLVNPQRPVLTHCQSAPQHHDLDLLLSMEVQERLQQQETQEKTQPPRQTRIRFALPQKPPRSPSAIVYPKARPIRSFNEEDMVMNQTRHSSKKPRRSGWRLFGDDDKRQQPIMSYNLPIGSRVRLKMRPLPTFGYVKYIGPVEEYGPGEFIGVELDFGGM